MLSFLPFAEFLACERLLSSHSRLSEFFLPWASHTVVAGGRWRQVVAIEGCNGGCWRLRRGFMVRFVKDWSLNGWRNQSNVSLHFDFGSWERAEAGVSLITTTCLFPFVGRKSWSPYSTEPQWC